MRMQDITKNFHPQIPFNCEADNVDRQRKQSALWHAVLLALAFICFATFIAISVAVFYTTWHTWSLLLTILSDILLLIVGIICTRHSYYHYHKVDEHAHTLRQLNSATRA